MNAEQNDWSVTIYADDLSEVPILRALCERAREAKISFGCVGIFTNTPECQPQFEGLVRFVCFTHKRWEELVGIFSSDEVLNRLKPKEVVLNWDKAFKGASVSNRRTRLSR